MLGLYENFPENIQKIAHFATSTSTKRLQQALIQILNAANNKTFSLENITAPSQPQSTAIFEFGIAKINEFNYLDKEETDKVLNAINKKPFQIMDFYCAIRYYKEQKEKKTPLKFDYYMIRFIFSKNSMEMQIFHERGPRYISPTDIANIIVSMVNETFSKKMLKKSKPS